MVFIFGSLCYNTCMVCNTSSTNLATSKERLQTMRQFDFDIQPKDTGRGHFYVSLAKSAIRIAAGISLIWPENIVLAGAFLIAAEVLGVVEELV